MGIQFISGLAAGTDGSLSASVTISTIGANFIRVSVECLKDTIPVVTDTMGNTWTPLTPRQSASLEKTQMFICHNPLTAAVHTFNALGGTVPSIQVDCFAGVRVSPAFSDENGTGTGSGNSVKPGLVTTTEPGCLILTSVNYLSSGGSVDTAFTAMVVDSIGGVQFGGGGAYLIQDVAGDVDLTWSWTGPASEKCSAVAIFYPVIGRASRNSGPMITGLTIYG